MYSRKLDKLKSVSEIKIGEQIIINTTEIAEQFNLYFSNIGTDLATEIPPGDVEPECYLKPSTQTFSLKIPTVGEVRNLLRKLNVRKAAGLDKIPCKLLIVAADIIAPSLTKIYQRSIISGIFPLEWKHARVTPVFKKGKMNNPCNYRPISVIPTVAKIFEKIVYDQLYNYLNENNLLTSCQSGFRSLHSTLTALIDTTNNWSVNIDDGLLNGVVFIDLQKAFDTIDHGILMRKLCNYGIDQTSLRWFRSYLSDRTEKCSVNGHLSNAASVSCGVPQGSNLLFLIYINDLPNCLSVASPNKFADDTNITVAADSLTELENKINFDLENLNRWLVANRLSLSVAKTEFMVIGSHQRVRASGNEEINVEISGKSITRVHKVKSLGLLIDEHLTWKDHVDETVKKISKAIGALKRVRPFISVKTALQIYHALIRPYFDYCSSVWGECSVTLCDKLQKLQNRAARVITRSGYDVSAKHLLISLRQDNLTKRRKKLKATLMFKILNGLAPDYLQDLLSIRTTKYNVRNLKRSFSYSASHYGTTYVRSNNLRTIESLLKEK